MPPLVLREAVMNAVCHRDFRAASQVRIFVFDDRIEIVNPGQLLNHLTLDSIRIGGISQRRNPVIASLLARAGGRENIGLGVCFRTNARARALTAMLGQPVDLGSLPNGVCVTRLVGGHGVTRIKAWE